MVHTYLKAIGYSFLISLALVVTCSYAAPILKIMVPKGEKVVGDPYSAAGATLSFGIVNVAGKFTFERKSSSEVKVLTNGSLVITFRCDCSNRSGGCNLIVSGSTISCAAGGCNKKCDLKLLVNMPVQLKLTNPER